MLIKKNFKLALQANKVFKYYNFVNSLANFLNKSHYQSNSTKKNKHFIIVMNNKERQFRYGKEQRHSACHKVISTQGDKDNHEHPMLTKIHS